MSDRSEYWREYARTHREQRREIERRREERLRAERGPIVKKCVGCGVEFTPHNNVQKFCTSECRIAAGKASNEKADAKVQTDHAEAEKTDAQFREQKRCEMTEAQKRRDRMRLRDSAYARWARENGVAPRFEDHGNKLVEIRGRVG